MTARRAMTDARKRRILAAHDGCCWRCGEAIMPDEPVEFDHKLALARGGTDDDENIGPAHVPCHALKTFGTAGRRLGSDIFEIAKTKRLAKKAAAPVGGNHAWPQRPMRDARWKRKVNGETVPR